MAKRPNLTFDQEQALGRLIRAGDVAARQELVDRNTGYVNKTWSRFRYICRDEDLRQEMFLGLLEATDKYDPDRGCKFLTIAQHYVKKYALLYLAKRNIVFVPPWIRKPESREGSRSHKSARAKARFDEAATAAECALRRPIYLSGYPRNGDEVVGAEQEQENSSGEYPELMKAIAALSPLEATVIRGRFGIGCRKESGKIIAARCEVHPQKIVIIRHNAIKKLRSLLANAS